VRSDNRLIDTTQTERERSQNIVRRSRVRDPQLRGLFLTNSSTKLDREHYLCSTTKLTIPTTLRRFNNLWSVPHRSGIP